MKLEKNEFAQSSIQSIGNCYLVYKRNGVICYKRLNSDSDYIYKIASNLCFSELTSMFMKHKKNFIKESTYSRYSTIVEKHILPFWGSYSLINIDNTLIDAYMESSLYKKGENGKRLSNKTIRDILSLFLLILKYGNRLGLIDVSKICIPFPKTEKSETIIFNRKEEETIAALSLNSTDPQIFGIGFALYTGMRIGELCALKWSDVNLSEKKVSVKKTLQRIKITEADISKKTKIIIDTPKTLAGYREIPIPSFMIKHLHKMYTEVESDECYFLTGSLKYIEPSNYYSKYQNWLCKIGVSRHSFHTLRHTFASRCVEYGCDIKTLSEILGHSNTNITLTQYVHSSMESKRASIELLCKNINIEKLEK